MSSHCLIGIYKGFELVNLRVLSETGLSMREAVGKSGDILSENCNRFVNNR